MRPYWSTRRTSSRSCVQPIGSWWIRPCVKNLGNEDTSRPSVFHGTLPRGGFCESTKKLYPEKKAAMFLKPLRRNVPGCALSCNPKLPSLRTHSSQPLHKLSRTALSLARAVRLFSITHVHGLPHGRVWSVRPQVGRCE